MSTLIPAYLQIRTWTGGFAIGAIHYYGTITLGGKNVDVERVLTASDARELSKEDRKEDSRAFVYHAGDKTVRFLTAESVIETAIESYKWHFPEAGFLIMSKKLVDAAEKIDWWEINEQEMEKIYQRWQKLLNRFKVSKSSPVSCDPAIVLDGHPVLKNKTS